MADVGRNRVEDFNLSDFRLGKVESFLGIATFVADLLATIF